MHTQQPKAQGLYDPRFEHENCGLGLITQIKGAKSHQLVQDALQLLLNLDHRGAIGADPLSGDGAGILLQLPDTFLRSVLLEEDDKVLPRAGHYGVGMVFMPQDKGKRRDVRAHFADIVNEEGQKILAWRKVPTNPDCLGETSRASMPDVRMIFIGRNAHLTDIQFERKLYKIRRRVALAVRNVERLFSEEFYIASLSSRTIVYKGMLTPHQVGAFYPDLSDERMESAIALVHSRFSTNTFPNWARAHPYRYLMHNGEINTIRGNQNWMNARQAQIDSPYFDTLEQVYPIIDDEGSDTAKFDNVLEFLTLNGLSLAHTMMMMVPEPWQKHANMSPAKRAFYEYHACLMEPWDGPAALALTDGTQVVATLDRNGLRPSRYYVTKDDRLILASEVGVLDVEPNNILKKGRLEPGRMLVVDTEEGRIIADEEVKAQLANEYPYQEWLDAYLLTLEDLEETTDDGRKTTDAKRSAQHATFLTHHASRITQQQLAFGYTFEDLRVLMAPMVAKGVEAIGSMGDDTPLAVLSDKPRLLYDYFKQLFAQVTNPPIDAIREELVTATVSYLGTDGNMLTPDPLNARRIKLEHPILTNAQLATLQQISADGFKAATLPILYNPNGGGKGMRGALEYLFEIADRAIEAGANLLILSDRDVNQKSAAVPALLASSALHHHLIRKGDRTRVSLVLESAEPREVHHFCTLFTRLRRRSDQPLPRLSPTIGKTSSANSLCLILIDARRSGIAKYIKAIVKGIVKVLLQNGHFDDSKLRWRANF